MRVVTLNLWGMRGDWATRRELIVAGLRELRPDLVAFQETITTDEYDQAADLLGGGFHLAHSREREADGQGITIASRWPIDGVRELDLNATPRTTDFACTTLIATVRVPDPIGPLVFVNHFPEYQLDHEHEREQQAVIAARAIEELVARHGEHVILVGDLDAEPDAASVRFLTGRQSLYGQSVCYRDAWESAHPGEPGDTFTPRNPLMAAANWDWPFLADRPYPRPLRRARRPHARHRRLRPHLRPAARRGLGQRPLRPRRRPRPPTRASRSDRVIAQQAAHPRRISAYGASSYHHDGMAPAEYTARNRRPRSMAPRRSSRMAAATSSSRCAARASPRAGLDTARHTGRCAAAVLAIPPPE